MATATDICSILLILRYSRLNFLTLNGFLYDRNAYTQKVGEINVTGINNRTYEIEGTFWFNATGYKHIYTNGIITPTNESVNVTQGEFYYHWIRR